jgi:hypothetical protein
MPTPRIEKSEMIARASPLKSPADSRNPAQKGCAGEIS